MFSGFMVDASNILSFKGEDNMFMNVKYAVQLWIFKPKETGEQVSLSNSQDVQEIHYYFFLSHHRFLL